VAVALVELAVVVVEWVVLEWATLEWAVVAPQVSPEVMGVTVAKAVWGQVAIKDMVTWENQLTNTRTNSRTSINTKTITACNRRLNHIMAPVTEPATMAKALKMVPAMVQIRPDNC
jgi:hypothetical protein